MPGDVDNNGLHNVLDAIAIVRRILYPEGTDNNVGDGSEEDDESNANNNDESSPSSQQGASQFKTPARVKSDPHFTGLRGQHYDVTGKAGAVYNILSDYELAINARFGIAMTTGISKDGALAHVEKGTWMTEIGIVTLRGDVQ